MGGDKFTNNTVAGLTEGSDDNREKNRYLILLKEGFYRFLHRSFGGDAYSGGVFKKTPGSTVLDWENLFEKISDNVKNTFIERESILADGKNPPHSLFTFEKLAHILINNKYSEKIKKENGMYYTPARISVFMAKVSLFNKVLLILRQFLRRSKTFGDSNESVEYENMDFFRMVMSGGSGDSLLRDFPDNIGNLLDVVIGNFLLVDDNHTRFIGMSEGKDRDYLAHLGNILRYLLGEVMNISILDPAVGTGNLTLELIDQLVCFYENIWRICRENMLTGILFIGDDGIYFDENEFGEKKSVSDWIDYTEFGDIIIYVLIYGIFPRITAVDIDSRSVIITAARLIYNLLERSYRYIYGEKRLKISYEDFFNFFKSTFDLIRSSRSFPLLIASDFFDVNIDPLLRNAGPYDIIIGNPPYGNLIPAWKKTVKYFPFSRTGYFNEISGLFLEKCIELNNFEGIVVFITSYTICFHKHLSLLREALASHYRTVKIVTLDRDKCRLFPNMTQSLSIVQAIGFQFDNGLRYNGVLTSRFYRSFPDLYSVEYYPANKFLLGKGGKMVYFSEIHRLPKIGTNADFLKALYYGIENADGKDGIDGPLSTDSESSVSQPIGSIDDSFGKLTEKTPVQSPIADEKRKLNHNSTESRLLYHPKLGDLLGTPKQLQDTGGADRYIMIYYRSSGNYWYNAWDRLPYRSSEIKALVVKKDFEHFVLCLINSQIFYIWMRIYGDGRHLNKDLLEKMPIPEPSRIIKYKHYLERIADNLMSSLFSVFDPARKRFITSQIKHVIDGVDSLLFEIYFGDTVNSKNITEDPEKLVDGSSIGKIFYRRHKNNPLLQYILSYDKEIHGGPAIDDNTEKA